LRAWWRIYWPIQIVAAILLIIVGRWQMGAINQWRFDHPLEASPLERAPLKYVSAVVGPAIAAACLWLFTSRILGRAFRGFRLVACGPAGEIPKLNFRQRVRLKFFVWWRYFAGGLLASLLAAPLNMMMATMGIASPSAVSALASLFAIGPVVMKMLVGSQLQDFRLEAWRQAPTPPRPDPVASTESSQ
jgi:hypothetical protein